MVGPVDEQKSLRIVRNFSENQGISGVLLLMNYMIMKYWTETSMADNGGKVSCIISCTSLNIFF
jgi:hypothetical protein